MPIKRSKEKKDPISRGWKFITMFGGEQLLRKSNKQLFYDSKRKKISYPHSINTKLAV
jgi:hypothetical protein